MNVRNVRLLYGRGPRFFSVVFVFFGPILPLPPAGVGHASVQINTREERLRESFGMMDVCSEGGGGRGEEGGSQKDDRNQRGPLSSIFTQWF